MTRFEFYNEPTNPIYAFDGLSPTHPNGALARSGQTLKRAVFQFEARVRVCFETYIFGIRGRCSWGSLIYLNPRVAKSILESEGYASSHELYPDILNKCISARFQLCVMPVSWFHFPHNSPDLPASAGIGCRFCALVVRRRNFVAEITLTLAVFVLWKYTNTRFSSGLAYFNRMLSLCSY